MITFAEDIKDVSIYLSLRQQVGWVSLTTEQAQQALDHSLKIITVYDDECPIGMGRIVGDGAVICYIQDLIIIPEYQSRHIGSMLIEKHYIKRFPDDALSDVCKRQRSFL